MRPFLFIPSLATVQCIVYDFVNYNKMDSVQKQEEKKTSQTASFLEGVKEEKKDDPSASRKKSGEEKKDLVYDTYKVTVDDSLTQIAYYHHMR